MSIKEKGYTHWDGEFRDDKYPWTPITRNGIKMTFRKKFFKLSFFISLIPALVFLVGIYIAERLEDFKFLTKDTEALKFLQIDPMYFMNYYTNDFLLFMIVMIMVFCGSGLISDDLRYNSLQLYFSRPIRKKDYFMGKASIIVFFLFIVTLVPGLVFLLMKLIFSGSFKFFVEYPWLFFSIVFYSFFVTAFFSFYTLLLSSLNKIRRYVAILIFGLYFFSDIIFEIFFGIFKNKYFSLLSIRTNIKQVGAFFFQQKAEYDISWIFSLLVIIGICFLSALVINRKICGVEVIK